MGIVFEITDKTGRRISLSDKARRHILKHPHMHDQIESIQDTLKNPMTIRYFEQDETVVYFYKDFKYRNPLERYLLISVKYLNGEGYIITSFFTNKVAGLKWKIK
ncbi:MAG: PBECR2 nuclease fold domain-containing protein [Nanoarchaeota archaeon]